MIQLITNPDMKEEICRKILENLSEWFGIPEAREEYISSSRNQDFWAAIQDEEAIGFLCLKPTGKDTVEIAAMGVEKRFHHAGFGRKLFVAAREAAAQKGFSFMQVKTVQSGLYKSYDATNAFYKSLGFKEFEIFPTLWDEWNPCQVYVMAI